MNKLNETDLKKFENDIYHYVVKTLYCKDTTTSLKFYRNYTRWFFKSGKIEWFNVIKIIMKNLDAQELNTPERWRSLHLEANAKNYEKVVPKAGTTATQLIVPSFDKINNQIVWNKSYVFDMKEMANLSIDITPSPSRIETSNEVLKGIISISDFINEVGGSAENLLNEFFETRPDFLDGYDNNQISLIKDVILFALASIGEYTKPDGTGFELNTDVIPKKCVLYFLHNIAVILPVFCHFLFIKCEAYYKDFLEEERRREIQAKVKRNIDERITSAKLELNRRKQEGA